MGWEIFLKVCEGKVALSFGGTSRHRIRMPFLCHTIKKWRKKTHLG